MDNKNEKRETNLHDVYDMMFRTLTHTEVLGFFGFKSKREYGLVMIRVKDSKTLHFANGVIPFDDGLYCLNIGERSAYTIPYKNIESIEG